MRNKNDDEESLQMDTMAVQLTNVSLLSYAS